MSRGVPGGGAFGEPEAGKAPFRGVEFGGALYGSPPFCGPPFGGCPLRAPPGGGPPLWNTHTSVSTSRRCPPTDTLDCSGTSERKRCRVAALRGSVYCRAFKLFER